MSRIKITKTISWNEEVRVELDLLWRTMEITDAGRFVLSRAKALNGRGFYEKLGESMGIPWWFIACIHGMECGFNFSLHLHNGDSLQRRTRRVPAGRPVEGDPPFTWMESARDALGMKGLDRVQDWSMPHALWLLEVYNGLGYRLYRRMPSPYLWAGTNHYTAGKYVSDGKYDATAVSKQAGCAGLIKTIL